ncbi:IclR family transcriptional regulator [Nocardioides massiliensis]|uniref:IclR family transcriptional regulator n=1 Tax=Nocardioides massiliensis TaxID=1325935 RepID=UPI0034CEF92A
MRSCGARALSVIDRMDVRGTLRPVLEGLHAEFQETVHLGRLGGSTVHFIEGTRAVRVGSRAGWSLPAHAMSTGQRMLSKLDPDALRSVYPHEALEAVTQRSLTGRSQLKEAFASGCRDAFATSNGESEEGVMSVAVAAYGVGGDLHAINVSVPKHRMTNDLRTQIVDSALRAGHELDGLKIWGHGARASSQALCVRKQCCVDQLEPSPPQFMRSLDGA